MKDSNELAYAKRIATSLWEKHWKEVSPDWQPIDDLMGVLTQIDNMTVGLHGEAPDKPDDDFPGPDDILRMRGKREAWIQRKPFRCDYGSDTYYHLAMQQWFREEPR